MKIGEKGKYFEGLRLQAYPFLARVWNINYGHTVDVKLANCGSLLLLIILLIIGAEIILKASPQEAGLMA